MRQLDPSLDLTAAIGFACRRLFCIPLCLISFCFLSFGLVLTGILSFGLVSFGYVLFGLISFGGVLNHIWSCIIWITYQLDVYCCLVLNRLVFRVVWPCITLNCIILFGIIRSPIK